MERALMSELWKWKDASNRKPLILWGARQVGKTWLMKEFGRCAYKNTVYISFYNNKRMASVFERDYDCKRIISAIETEMRAEINPEDTILLFDEVQEAPRVVESLKYFCEEAREYSVIAAGSLLGVSIHEGVSFPVGKVDELHLYPMSFREFLRAVGRERLADYCSDYKSSEVADFSELYSELLKEYYCVGGMPEVVASYVKDRDFVAVREIQNSILSQYEGDFGKHIDARQLPRLRMVWNSIPIQLAKENRKFFFGQIKKGARMSEFELAIQWLTDAGLLYKVNKVTAPSMPLKAYVDFAAFKLFMLDVGLLAAQSELDIESMLHGNRVYTEFKGALTEQYVLQQLISDTAYTPYYYSGEKSTYETDFLIQRKTDIIPLEVKAEDNLKSRSLKAYCKKFSPAKAFRISTANYRKQDWMENIPLWSVCGL